MCSCGSSRPSGGGGGGGAAGGAATPCSDCRQRTIPPREVDVAISETISNAPTTPTDYSAWNGTFGWQSKFTVAVDRPNCSVKVTIKIKVTGTITDAQKTAWKSAIESKWSNKVKLVCNDPACPQACTGGYPVIVELRYVGSGEHYTVTANTPGAAEGGRAGLGGTTSMTGWGVNDTVDITHEFGHMLGNVEEYFTTDRVDYTHGGTVSGFRDAGGGIMNNPSNDPTTGNFHLVAQQAQAAMGGNCTAQTP